MKATLLLLCLLSTARSEFTADLYPASPDILPRLISVAERSGDPLASRNYEDGGRSYSYYLSGARYVGSCRAPFGLVHIASLDFTRSAAKGSTQPARLHTFIAFFDESLRLRGIWRTGDPAFAPRLSVRDSSQLFYGETLAIDFMHLPPAQQHAAEERPVPHVVVGGDQYTVPTW